MSSATILAQRLDDKESEMLRNVVRELGYDRI